jgi:formate-dependent nitrite reductase membrane component NrfD
MDQLVRRAADDPVERAEARGDGRNVDPDVGLLLGEGAAQRVRGDGDPAPREPRAAIEGEGPSYYGLPVLKAPVWTWEVPTYFAVGGLAGASAVLGAAAQLLGGRGARDLVRRCRLVAIGGAVASAGLLTSDLGRPARFVNMLRVFRPTSPMNMGTWVLTSFGALSALAAIPAIEPLPRGLRRTLRPTADVAAIGAGALGLPLVGYTGVLLANTAVPVWQGTRNTLPVMFAFSGAVSATGLFQLWPPRGRGREMARRFGLLAKGAEVVFSFAMHAEPRVPRVARALEHGAAGWLLRTSRVLTAASLAFDLALGGRRRGRVASGVLALAGTLALRYGILAAGRQSARDPQATFAQQRAGHGAEELVRKEPTSAEMPTLPGIDATGKEAAELGRSP